MRDKILQKFKLFHLVFKNQLKNTFQFHPFDHSQRTLCAYEVQKNSKLIKKWN